MRDLISAAMRECTSLHCRFRYPDINVIDFFAQCPKCHEKAGIIHVIDLTRSDNHSNANDLRSHNVICILDNIRSVYNVGSLFRTMQGFGISEAILGGITPTPSHIKFRKTSMGAEEDVRWYSANNAFEQCQSLKNNGYMLIAIEASSESKPIRLFEPPDERKKIAFIVGNEIIGIDPSILKLCDQILSIPIVGRNKSYNVTVAFGIGLYACLSMP